MTDLRVRIGNLALANPVMPASGTFSPELAALIDFNRLGALVPKTFTRQIRQGNPEPRLAEVPGGMVASIGIPSKGLEHFLAETVPFYRRFAPPLIASISAETPQAFADLARETAVEGVAAIELNLSCPNLEADGRAFAMVADTTERTVAACVKEARCPIWAKLTPNVGDMTEIAKAAELGGAQAVVVANGFLAMAIDAETFRPRVGNVMGGLTGPAPKPIILRFVYQCARAVSIPVIGCGGIATTEDTVEYMLAGAAAVQVGTATFVDPDAMTTIIDGLDAFCTRKGIARVADLTGALILPTSAKRAEKEPVL